MTRMTGAKAPSAEQDVLRARARGELSADAAFERLHAAYAPSVRAWLLLRVRGTEADDLVQDVWTIFYHRWRRWEHRPEMADPRARPVLSFLYRTCHFVLKGHRRRARREEAGDVDVADGEAGAKRLIQGVEVGRCLDRARRLCHSDELDVLFAKLSGVPAREIARALDVTESVVDHRFRTALAKLRASLTPRAKGSPAPVRGDAPRKPATGGRHA
jgi:DNA-directed RNA polymerase specialized sigma24 family protein